MKKPAPKSGPKRKYYDPKKARSDHLSKNYMITSQEYDIMLALQNGACAICGLKPPHGARRLAVDHHEVLERIRIRGLLCTRCNLGIGYFSHQPELLERAIGYLAKPRDILREAENVIMGSKSTRKAALGN